MLYQFAMSLRFISMRCAHGNSLTPPLLNAEEVEESRRSSLYFPLAVIAPTYHDGFILCSNIACAASSPLAP